MQVETYEVEELLSAERDPLDPSAVELIEALGLQGQKRFVGKATDGETLKVIPYRLMTVEELRVYHVLFPQRTVLEDYAGCPIPLRVLQVAAHARQLPSVTKLEVWHPPTGVMGVSDPLLVAVSPDPQFRWREQFHLLARWGSALEPFERLRELASEKLTVHWRADAESVRTKVDAFLTNVDTRVAAFLHGRGDAPSFAPDAVGS